MNEIIDGIVHGNFEFQTSPDHSSQKNDKDHPGFRGEFGIRKFEGEVDMSESMEVNIGSYCGMNQTDRQDWRKWLQRKGLGGTGSGC